MKGDRQKNNNIRWRYGVDNIGNRALRRWNMSIEQKGCGEVISQRGQEESDDGLFKKPDKKEERNGKRSRRLEERIVGIEESSLLKQIKGYKLKGRSDVGRSRKRQE